jgi:hypothetical protein
VILPEIAGGANQEAVTGGFTGREQCGRAGMSYEYWGGGEGRLSQTWEKEYMRLVLRERGADQAWITVGSGDDAIRVVSRSSHSLCVSDGRRNSFLLLLRIR